jgi:hypothetical protein
MKSKGAPTFLNFGQPYPQQVFTAVIWGRWRSHFPYPPESLQGHEVCISGTITTYKGFAQIEVVRPAQIEITQRDAEPWDAWVSPVPLCTPASNPHEVPGCQPPL